MNLLVFDIGNTSIKMGLVSIGAGEGAPLQVRASYVFPSNVETTADSLGLTILACLQHVEPQAGCAPHFGTHGFDACVAASVVPAISQILRQAVRRYLGCPCLFAVEDLPVPLENHYARPAEVGADLLVGAYAARRLLPAARGMIVVDYGTAATFACVNGDAYLGGLIFPGPATAASALALKTAKLPHVSLDINPAELADAPAPGKDTVTCIRHGLLFGYAAMTEGLCARLAKQLPQPLKIVATGGFARTIATLTAVFDRIEPDLLLAGLARLYLEARQGRAACLAMALSESLQS